MLGKQISHYKILQKLGSGGMGTVYKAEDTKLDRFVALKFLPPHLIQVEETKKRFIHEAKSASALTHPNIATIYEIDEADGQMFIAMEYIEGQSLRQLIPHDPPLRKEGTGSLLDYAIQIAEGLAKAHSKGIIHRDIKPANILVTKDGMVKIADFGLAKLASATMLTKEGTMLGTVAYMSPEQTHGMSIDHRTDIWSMGVVLYEMVTGEQPFQGDYEQAVIYSILNEEPKPITNLEQVPKEFGRVIEKTLQKEPANRYENMTELKKDLQAINKKIETKQEKSPAEKSTPLPSIAVLPFENMSADPEQEYFCDGMAEEIINALVNVQNLRVAARTSAFAFKGKQQDIREIGRKLSVDKILEGSVRKAGIRLRITAQLIDVADGYHLWSERYDREMDDVFTIQDDISRAIVNALRIKLDITKEQPLVKRATENLDAYDAYLRGIYCYNLRTRKDNEQAIQLLEKATDLDSSFALAFAALAYAYIEKFFTYQPRETWEQKAFVAIEKALALEPELAEAYVARGLLLWTKSHHFPHEKAIIELQRAIAIKPNLAHAHSELARVLWHIGLVDEAYQALTKAMQLEPTDVKAQFRIGWLEMQRGNYASGLSFLQKLPPESVAEWVHPLIAMCLWYMQRKEKAFAQLEQMAASFANDPAVLSTEAILLADAGKEKEAVEKIKLAIEKGKHLGHFHHMSNNIAAAYALMNKKKQALDWLEKTAEDGFPCYPWFDKDPCLQNIRNEPRFKALIKRLRMQWQPAGKKGTPS